MPEPVAPAQQTLGPAMDGYLASLVVALELPNGERIEVRDEIGAHLVDLRSELVEGGMSPESAAAEAIRRLGPPNVLAHEITHARQTRRALLAAIGGATWAATGAAARGLILGLAGVTLVAVAAMLAMAGASMVFGTGTWTLWDAGWFTAFGAAVFWAPAWLAGRTLVSVTARRSHRPAERVRRWIGLVGGSFVALVALVWFEAPQNLWSVVALALVPFVFIAASLSGTDQPTELSTKARGASLALFATVLVAIPVLGVLIAAPVSEQGGPGVRSGPYSSMQALLHATGFDLPGRFVPDPPDLGTTAMTLDHGLATGSLENAGAVTTRWHDLRVEVWRASPSDGELDRAYTLSFATAPLTVQAGHLVGSVRVDRTRNVTLWTLVVTGIAQDGGRDLIATLGGSNSTFTGSVLDWLTAP
jgi:hypothetical protein